MSKYCKKTTINHSLAKAYKCCVKLINEIVETESHHQKEKRCDFENVDFKDEKALDFDCITQKQNPNPPSVDMIIGLDNQKMLGVEFKLNAERTPPFISKSLVKKKTSTQSLISDNIQGFILVFCDTNKDIKAKIQNYLRKIEKGYNKPEHGYKMMFLDDFKTTYF